MQKLDKEMVGVLDTISKNQLQVPLSLIDIIILIHAIFDIFSLKKIKRGGGKLV